MNDIFSGTKDPTVNMEHATIVVNDDSIHLIDLGSNFGTFVDGTKVLLEAGATIKFGNEDFTFTLQYQSFVFSISMLSNYAKKLMTKSVLLFKGTVVDEFQMNCTHLVMDDLMITMKVLPSLLEGILIVLIKIILEDGFYHGKSHGENNVFMQSVMSNIGIVELSFCSSRLLS